jgi:hypothetical protein
VLAAVDEFWFPTMPAARLAALRILIGAYALVYVGTRFALYSDIAEASGEAFRPTGLISLLKTPISPDAFRVLLALTLVVNVVFVLGWCHRVTGPLFAGLFLGVMSYRNSWGIVYHSDEVVVLHLLILGLTRSADAWSVDAYQRANDAPESWRYGYPIRLLCTITLITYFLAGVAKVAGPLGWAWAGGEGLRAQLAVDAMRKDLLGSGAPPLVFFLFQHVWLFAIIGVATLVIELIALPLILSRRAARWWAVLAIMMHWSIYAVMGIQFWYHQSGVIYTPFFDLERLPAWLRTQLGRLRRSDRAAQPSAALDTGG